MILYHTSDQVIKNPDIHRGRKNADFGWGFYLTPDKEFSYRWARTDAIVNRYNFDETELDIHYFKRDVDWFEYIYYNRRLKDSITADAVIGPIANDTIFDTLGILSSGYLKPEEALRLLLIGPEYIQVVIKNEKALAKLQWLDSEKIEQMDSEKQKEEQKAYQKLFAKEMLKLSGN